MRRREPHDRPQLRVLHLGFEDPAMPGAGGGSLRTHEINRRLVADGMDVTVLTTRYPGCTERVQDGVRYVHVGVGSSRRGCRGCSATCWGCRGGAPASRAADLVVEDFFAPFSSMAAPLWTGRPTIGMVQWLHAREKAGSTSCRCTWWSASACGATAGSSPCPTARPSSCAR